MKAYGSTASSCVRQPDKHALLRCWIEDNHERVVGHKPTAVELRNLGVNQIDGKS